MHHRKPIIKPTLPVISRDDAAQALVHLSETTLQNESPKKTAHFDLSKNITHDIGPLKKLMQEKIAPRPKRECQLYDFPRKKVYKSSHITQYITHSGRLCRPPEKMKPHTR